MDIGMKIKRLRVLCQLTQEELANRCELTKGYISQIENDLTSPSIATLIDILSALGTNLKDFFNEEMEEKIVFKENDYIEKDYESHTINWLVPNSQKNEMEPILVELQEASKTSLDMPHEGQEFGYVLEGKIKIHIGTRTYIASKGETFYFVSDKNHYIENINKGISKIIWVSSPPNF